MRLQTAGHHAESNGEQHDTEGNDGYQASAEGRREKVACGRQQYRMRRERQQGDDHHIDQQEHDGDTQCQTRPIVIGIRLLPTGTEHSGYPTLLQTPEG